MKKVILLVAVLSVAVGLGFISVRLGQTRAVNFPPHTVIYRLTSFDKAGKVIRVSVVVRHVSSDGTWKHTQVNPEGPVVSSNGRLKGTIVSQRSQPDWPEHLGYKYMESKGKTSSAWLSPELQDFLKFMVLREDGTTDETMEAVHVSTP